jgi:hypothetical protein
MMMQLLAAMRAGVGHFQITPEHGPNAASRAFARGTAEHRGKDWARAMWPVFRAVDLCSAVLHHAILMILI